MLIKQIFSNIFVTGKTAIPHQQRARGKGFAVHSLDKLTSNVNAGTLTPVGTTTSKAAIVTVSGAAAPFYSEFASMEQGQ